MSGEVDDGAFLAVMAGEDPSGSGRLGRRYGAESVQGFDVTASAPKSVSVLFAVGDPHTRRHVLDAHDAAVGAMIAWVERHAHTRHRIGGEIATVDADGIIAAAFRQHTSRVLDPQLHTHVVIANRVRSPDGRWLALDARTLKLDQRTVSAVYHAGLRTELTRRLGVAWEPPVNGIADIAGIPPDILDAFSQRTGQVRGRLDAKVDRFIDTFDRQPTARERWRLEREAVLDSRPAKTGAVDGADLHQTWLRQVEALGHHPDAILDQVLARSPGHGLDRPAVEEMIGEALTNLGDKQSTWRPAELVRELAAVVPTDTASDAGRLAPFLDRLADHVIATHCVDLSRPIPSGVPLRRDGRPVTESAVDRVLTTPAILPRGTPPGLGRTPLRQRHRPPPRRRPQRRPAQQPPSRRRRRRGRLQRPGARRRTRRHGQDHRPGPRRRPTRRRLPVRVRRRPLGRRRSPGRRDRRGGRHPRQAPHRTHPAPATRRPVPATGGQHDHRRRGRHGPHRQARPARRSRRRQRLAGRPRRGSVAVLRRGPRRHVHPPRRRPRRHRARPRPPLQPLLGGCRQSPPPPRDPGVVSLYQAHGRLHGGTATRMESEAVTAWHHARRRGGTALLAAPTTDVVERLNHRAQQLLIDTGHLDPTGGHLTAGPYRLHVGDEIVARRNHRTLRTDRGHMIRNRDTWTITALHTDGALTATGRTGTIHLPADYVADHVGLGYAQTSHATQGRTVDHAHLVLDRPCDTRGLYVPLTRGRHSNHAYLTTTGEQTATDVFTDSLSRTWIDEPAVAHRDLHNARREPLRRSAPGIEDAQGHQPTWRGSPAYPRRRPRSDPPDSPDVDGGNGQRVARPRVLVQRQRAGPPSVARAEPDFGIDP